ncbi:alternative ribosome rescue aminoacyl-tRNA hydrolase ArfB [Halobacteriovorax sp.]|uniref:alternative ribosome rescue aminoacyl-tRNA hydrolase ArfB n=1 Tax=Halobacteriovorax sp. TaxID=2020862 RepID=UPI0035628D2A
MIELLEKEVQFTFSRASGKGGQNVNKLNTKANLSWNIYDSKLLTYREKENFKLKYPNSIKEGGSVIITSSLHRTQKLNKDECLRKLMKLISKAKEFKKVRVKTKPTRSSQEKRIKEKKSKGLTKKLRQEKF